MADLPRWVKLLGIIIGILLLLFVVLRLAGVGGEHGPGRHFSSVVPMTCRFPAS